jgi:hypothetical protein
MIAVVKLFGAVREAVGTKEFSLEESDGCPLRLRDRQARLN